MPACNPATCSDIDRAALEMVLSGRWKLTPDGEVIGERGRPFGSNRGLDQYARLDVVVESRHTTAYAHRLVYLWFIGDIPPGYEVDHIDGHKGNTLPSNLRLVSHRQNMVAARAMGLCHVPASSYQRGEVHHNTRFTASDVLAIRARAAAGQSIRSLGREYGCSYSTISRVTRREVWGHI